MSQAAWKQQILGQLQRRDNQQRKAFLALIEQSTYGCYSHPPRPCVSFFDGLRPQMLH